MNKTELIQKIAAKTGMSRAKSQKALNALTESVSEELSRGGKVGLVGFGTFSVVQRAARKGRNPRTGEEILIDPGKSPKFKPGKGLKIAVS